MSTDIIRQMKAMDPQLHDEECLIAYHILNVINSAHPEYAAVVSSASGYHKVHIPDKISNDHVVSRIKCTRTNRWFSLNIVGISADKRKSSLLENALDKTKNHWRIPIDKLDDLALYDSFFLEIAEYLWQTYKIYKYRDPGSSVLYSHGAGIMIKI